MGNTPSITYGNRLAAERDNESEMMAHDSLPVLEYNNETLADSFQSCVQAHGDRNFLGTRTYLEDGKRGEYVWKTYSQINEAATALANGMINEDLAPVVQEEFPIRFVGVHSKNREEYVTLIQSCIMSSVTTVPLYDTLGPDVIEYILNHTRMSTIFCTDSSLEVLFKLAKDGQVEQLKNIVVFDAVKEETVKQGADCGLKVYSLDQVIASGKEKTQELPKPKPDDVYYISYTSGTTGTPKAAMITHKNMFTQASAVLHVLSIKEDDVTISYLPLAHIAETTILQVFVRGGGSVGFYSGDPRMIKDDLAVLRPTFFPGVPRIYNRFYDVIQSQFRAATGMKKKIIDRAVAAKVDGFNKTGSTTHALYDKLVFGKVKAVLGGRVKTLFTAAAPINGDVLKFLKICFSATFYEIYGQTENSGAATYTKPGDPLIGHIGNVIPGIQAKVQDIPDMKYFATDKDEAGNSLPRGELCLRGSIVFRGYYKDAGKTKETIDENGWLHTGDIASIDSTGRIRIIDRKKAIFKLSQGEYVAPEKIENVYVTSHLVAQSWVYGDSLRDYTVGIIVPDADALKKEVQEKLSLSGEVSELIKNPEVNKLILEDLKQVGKTAGLKGFEGVRKVHLETEGFSPENGMLTPTFKMKRNEAKAKYLDVIHGLYDN